MSPEAWIAIGSLAFSLMVAVATVAWRFSKVDSKLESHSHAELAKVPELAIQVKNLESRVEEDRNKNTEQHKDFYDFRRETEPVLAEILQQITSIASTQARILDKFDELERRER